LDDSNKYPENLRKLIDTILELVPEAHDQRDNIYALIKTFIHKEKHFLWEDLSFWLTKDNVYWVYDHIINPKINTHSLDNWGNFDKNLEWVKKYQAIPNSIKFIKS